MQTIQTEIKGIAKAVGASLKRSGHQVPHSVLLHALAAALDKRDWHKLKAGLEEQGTPPAYGITAYKSQGKTWASAMEAGSNMPASVAGSLAPRLYSDHTLGMLRLASALLRPVHPLPIDDSEARQAAYLAVGTLSGIVTFKDLVIPAVLTPQGWLISDPEDTVRKRMGLGSLSFAQFCFATPAGTFSVDAEYAPNRGWSLTGTGEQKLFDQLSTMIPAERLFPSGSKVFMGNTAHLPPVGAGSVLTDLLEAQPADLVQIARQTSTRLLPASTGPVVKARFWTDDHRFEADFEAQDYFAQASVDSLLSIAEVGFSGDYCTDYVAEFMQGRNEDIDDGFAYIHALQKSAMKDPPGFECSVDAGDYFRWMDHHYRSELAQWLCVQEGVIVSQPDEPEILGKWCWHLGETACDRSFDSQVDACLNAYENLRLLQNALDGHYKA